MPSYENIMVTITLFLFFTNAVFLFAAFLPGTQDGSGGRLDIGMSAVDINDMNNKITGILGYGDIFKPDTIDISSAVDVTGEQKDYLTLFQEWLFGSLDTATLGLSTKVIGGISILGTVISLFGATFFGYLFWIDFFINPLWGPGFWAIGAIFKVFFFMVQAMWLFDIIYKMFFAGTGTRG